MSNNLRRLLNMALYHDPFFIRPSRFFNQPLSLTYHPDFFKPMEYPRVFQEVDSQLSRPWITEATEDEKSARVSCEKDKFEANIDVKDFQPDEITVKIAEDNSNTLVVEGKHEQRTDEENFVSRKFVRRYVLPENYDISKVESRLSSDGMLTIVAPANEVEYKTIPIQQTGEPTKQIKEQEK